MVPTALAAGESFFPFSESLIHSGFWVALQLFVIRKLFGSGKSVCYLKIKKTFQRRAILRLA
jgi:hypothetical protein